MSPEREPVVEPADRLAGLVYWLSLLLLLSGTWVLIDPLNRRCGETLHIYVTLGAFEVYIWLLLGLGRWQRLKPLPVDAVRSSLFAAILTGLLFVAVNELHVASQTGTRWVAMVAAVLTTARLLAARPWLGLNLPGPLVAYCLLWVLALAVPAPVLKAFADSRSSQHLMAYVMCCGVALLVACHIPLVAWQTRRGWPTGTQPLERWWGPWLLLGILAAISVGQLYAVMWAYFVDWAQWYFSPILLAVGVVAVSLAHACGQRRQEAWVVMGLAVAHACVVWVQPQPEELQTIWSGGQMPRYASPIYVSGAFVSVLLALAGLLTARRWLLGLAMVPSVVAGTVNGVQAMLDWRHGKGATLLMGAFALLGIGMVIQWWQHRGKPAAIDMPRHEE